MTLKLGRNEFSINMSVIKIFKNLSIIEYKKLIYSCIFKICQ